MGIVNGYILGSLIGQFIVLCFRLAVLIARGAISLLTALTQAFGRLGRQALSLWGRRATRRAAAEAGRQRHLT